MIVRSLRASCSKKQILLTIAVSIAILGGVSLEASASSTYVIPAVAHLRGVGNTLWRTDVAAVNRNAGPADINLTFLTMGGNLNSSLSLAAGATTEWSNVLESVFGLGAEDQSSGSIVVTSTVPLTLSSRTFNQTADGTFGQYCPALTEEDALGPGEVGFLPLAKSTEAFRTNIGMINLGDQSCTVAVKLYGANGSQLGTIKELTAFPRRWKQQSDIFAAAGAGNHEVAYATIEVTTAGGEAWAYASVVDNNTGDPTTVPVQVVEAGVFKVPAGTRPGTSPEPGVERPTAADILPRSAGSEPYLDAGTQVILPTARHGRTERASSLELVRSSSSTMLPEGGLWLGFAESQTYVTSGALPPKSEHASENPTAAAVGDFDNDGMPDLAVISSEAENSLVTLYRGNEGFLFPNSAEAADSDQPFHRHTSAIPLDRALHWVAAGDFDADGSLDLVVATKNASTIQPLWGDGRLGFELGEPVEIVGKITAMAAGDINRPDGLTDLVIAVHLEDRHQLYIFEGPLGALRHEPETVPLSGSATVVDVGRIDPDPWPEIVVALEDRVLVVEGRDRRLSAPGEPELLQPRTRSLEIEGRISGLAMGNFAGDHHLEPAVLLDDGSVWLLDAIGRQAPELIASSVGAPGDRLSRAHVSSSPKDDIVVVGAANRPVRLLYRDVPWAQGQATKSVDSSPVRIVEINSVGAPVSIVPMRLNADAMTDLVVLSQGLPGLTIVTTKTTALHLVNDPEDGYDFDLEDGICDAEYDPDIVRCTYTAAIGQSNYSGGSHTITFAVSSVGPIIGGRADVPVVIDGSSQGRVNIDGSIQIAGGGSTVRKMVVQGHVSSGIWITGPGGDFVEGCWIGPDSTGQAAPDPPIAGITIEDAPNTTIGSPVAQGGNVISGCNHAMRIGGESDSTVLNGNIFGMTVDGSDLLNNWEGIRMDNEATGCRIGGAGVTEGNIIAGTDVFAGLTISDPWSDGLEQGTLVQGNYFSDCAGPGVGVSLSHGNTIGGTTPYAGNEIVNNGEWSEAAGVAISDWDARDNLVQGNSIGVMRTGEQGGNAGHGVRVYGSNNIVGGTQPEAGNTIAYNNLIGINISVGTGHSILYNSIHDNGLLGIGLGGWDQAQANDPGDTDTGPNNSQNYPELEIAVSVDGVLNSEPNKRYRLQFFSNTTCDPSGHGEGETFLDTYWVETDGSGSATFSTTIFPDPNLFITATATDPDGNTSEFSACATTPTTRVDSISPSVAPSTTAEPEYFTEPLTVVIIGEGFIDSPETTVLLEGEQSAHPTSSGIQSFNDCGIDGCTSITAQLTGFDGLEEGMRDVVVVNPGNERLVGRDLFFVSSLRINPLEINQGIPSTCSQQDPCLAHHNTVIRASVTCEGVGCINGKSTLTAALHVHRNGLPIEGSPFAPDRPLKVSRHGAYQDVPDRIAARTTLNYYFVADNAFEEGDYELQLVLDPRNVDQQPGAFDSNRHLHRTLDAARFENGTEALKIAVMVDGNSPQDIAEAIASFGFLRATYPLSGIDVHVHHVDAGVSFSNEDETLLELMQWHQQQKASSAEPFTHLVYITANPGLQSGGLSMCGKNDYFLGLYSGSFFCKAPVVLVKRNTVLEMEDTIAHELGHTYLLGDTYVEPSNQTSEHNPITADCEANQRGCPVEDGHFDTITRTVSVVDPVYPGAVKVDFMGNQQRDVTWTDLRTWNYLEAKMVGKALGRHKVTTNGDRVAVLGALGRDDSVHLLPIVPVPADADEPDLPEGDYAVEVRENGGQVLASTSFFPMFSYSGDQGETAMNTPFRVVTAFPSNATSIAVVRDGVDLAVQTLSANPPQVEVLSPNGGEQLGATTEIAWTASDTDGDTLTASVFYSTDNASWIPLAIGLEETSYLWDTSLTPGSSTGRIKVVVNDGVREGSDVSDDVFTVNAKDPIAVIVNPTDGAQIGTGDNVVLRGSGYDIEDGELVDAALVWTSSLDGSLGDGAVITAADLGEGAHTITLTVTDGDGHSGFTSITLYVGDIEKPFVYLVPAVAHSPGVGGTMWRTDLAAVNAGTSPAALSMLFRRGNTTDTWEGTISTGGVSEWGNIVESAFGLNPGANVAGTVEVSSSMPLAISSRTYNQTPEGTYGQYLPGLETGTGLLPGTATVLPHLKSTDGFRTNVGALNLGTGACSAAFQLFDGSGTAIGAVRSIDVPVGLWKQQSDIFAATWAGDHAIAYATVQLSGDGCLAWAYASVVDNESGDPTTIPLLAVE